jgi:hypothetical protein
MIRSSDLVIISRDDLLRQLECTPLEVLPFDASMWLSGHPQPCARPQQSESKMTGPKVPAQGEKKREREKFNSC